MKGFFWAGILVAALVFAGRAEEVEPLSVSRAGSRETGRYSDRTVTAAFVIDRDGARLFFFTLKQRPYERALRLPEARPFRSGERVQMEVALVGPGGKRHTRRVDVGKMCLEHGADTAAHVQGDTVLVHRDSFIVDLPESPGFDRVEVAYHRTGPQGVERKVLATETLDARRFVAAGERVSYIDLAFADLKAAAAAGLEGLTAGTVHWPEEFGDTNRFLVFGNAGEASQRINIVIVPDGYTYSSKALMESDASALVARFRSTSPFKEHDPFINYTLVYAYSTQNGTDECDCDTIKDTAMGTGFIDEGYPCLDPSNRCLYYSNGCDTDTSANIASAELRAPAQDVTIVMVNTTRYGGCGGARAVYSAGDSDAEDIARHELGHALADLADEYDEFAGCGTFAGEINTSLNSSSGAWPEWISSLGAPRQGGEYYPQCIYRPDDTCLMREFVTTFCPVCIQRWSLVIFGHSRVSSTAPIASSAPTSPVTVPVGQAATFSVTTRLATGVVNSITWRLQGPGFPVLSNVFSSGTTYTRTFLSIGNYTLSCEVIGDTSLIKPAKYGANRDTVSWLVSTAGTGLRGDYFDNADFTGFKISRVDTDVNFDWGSSSPDSSVGSDTFSSRWRGWIVPINAQTYTFSTVSDEGLRLWVNGAQLINNWTGHTATTNTGSIYLSSGQQYDVQMDHFENTGNAVAKLLWAGSGQSPVAVAASNLYPAVGLRGEYYGATNLTNWKLNRVDSQVNFDWAYSSPDPLVSTNSFSVRWTGQVVPRFSETYTFSTVSDDGVRLWVNGQSLVNNWTNHGTTTNTGAIALTAGKPYDIKMEYYDNTGRAVAKLLWASPSQPLAPIPAAYLRPNLGMFTLFYPNTNMGGVASLTNLASKIDFNWGQLSPHYAVPTNNFSLHAFGQIMPRYSQTYTFYTVSDDGVKLWVNGVLLLTNWTDHGATTNAGAITLTAGRKYDVRLDYYDHNGGAQVKLLWSSPSQAKEIIPALQCFLATNIATTGLSPAPPNAAVAAAVPGDTDSSPMLHAQRSTPSVQRSPLGAQRSSRNTQRSTGSVHAVAAECPDLSGAWTVNGVEWELIYVAPCVFEIHCPAADGASVVAGHLIATPDGRLDAYLDDECAAGPLSCVGTVDSELQTMRFDAAGITGHCREADPH